MGGAGGGGGQSSGLAPGRATQSRSPVGCGQGQVPPCPAPSPPAPVPRWAAGTMQSHIPPLQHISPRVLQTAKRTEKCLEKRETPYKTHPGREPDLPSRPRASLLAQGNTTEEGGAGAGASRGGRHTEHPGSPHPCPLHQGVVKLAPLQPLLVVSPGGGGHAAVGVQQDAEAAHHQHH